MMLTIIGAKMGPVGAFVGNKAGAGLTALKAAGISQTNDLVKEAMLHPALGSGAARATDAIHRGCHGQSGNAHYR